MIIGRWTKRMTADVEAEQAKRVKAKAISTKLVELILAENVAYRAQAHRWGLSEGIIDRGASQGTKPPDRVPASV